MSDRKRKRKRQAAAAKAATRRDHQPAPEPTQPPSGRDAMARGYARAEERNARIRDELEPLEPGERPRVLLAALGWIGLLGAGMVLNAILADGDDAAETRLGNLLTAGLVVIAIAGAWRVKHWALMGVQTILAIATLVGVLAMLGVTKLWVVPLLLLHVGISGYLFFRMVRVLARVQKADRLRRAG